MAESGSKDGFPIKRIDSYILVTSKSTESLNYPEDEEKSPQKEFNHCYGNADTQPQERIGQEKEGFSRGSVKTADQALKRIKCKSKIIETLQKHEELKKKYATLLDKVGKKVKSNTPETQKLEGEAESDKI